MANHECSQTDNIAEIKEAVHGIEKTLYKGNGKPPIVSQLEVGNQKFAEIDKKLDSIMAYGRAIVMAVLGLVGATLWDVLQKHNAETYGTKNQVTTKGIK